MSADNMEDLASDNGSEISVDDTLPYVNALNVCCWNLSIFCFVPCNIPQMVLNNPKMVLKISQMLLNISKTLLHIVFYNTFCQIICGFPQSFLKFHKCF